MSRGPLTVRVARWSATHPWRAMGLWTVFVALCFTLGSMTGLKEANENDNPIGEAGRAHQIVDTAGFDDPTVESVLITPRSGSLDTARAGEAAAAARTRMATLPVVEAAGEPIAAPDGGALLVRVTLRGETDDAGLQSLLDTTAAVQRDFPDLRVEQVGGLSINKALDETVMADFRRAELFSIPVTLLILLVAFGALIAAGVPLLLALSAVAAAIGLSTAASHLVPAVETANSVILLIGLAVGVDYSLFYLKREREERARGRGHVDAVEIAAATSGRAVVVSGLAVIIAMAGLYLAGDFVFSSLATGAILVVAVAVAGSLTVLPAVLAKLGRWVDRPRIPLLWRLTARSGGPRLWPILLRPALRRPAITLAVSVGALLLLALPALDMKLRFPSDADLPRTTAVMQAYDRLTAAFPSTGTSHVVAVLAPAERGGEVRTALEALAARTAGDPLFARDALTEVRVSPDGRTSYLDIASPYPGGSDEAVQALHKLRDDLVPATLGAVPDVEYAVGGFVAFNEDYAAHIGEKLPLVMGVVMALTFIVMTLTFRSVVVAVTSILLNLLSAVAAYGLVQLVFGGTWAENLLGFDSINAVVSWLPLFLFVVLFGLSMDYHVFVVSRIREAVLRGVPNREAVASGIVGSAGVVTSAAAVMVAVFAIFATLSMIDMKQLGVGLAAAILIDATIIRAVVLPSVMTLLGDANWWAPRFLRRRTPEPGAGRPDAESELEPVALAGRH